MVISTKQTDAKSAGIGVARGGKGPSMTKPQRFRDNVVNAFGFASRVQAPHRFDSGHGLYEELLHLRAHMTACDLHSREMATKLDESQVELKALQKRFAQETVSIDTKADLSLTSAFPSVSDLTKRYQSFMRDAREDIVESLINFCRKNVLKEKEKGKEKEGAAGEITDESLSELAAQHCVTTAFWKCSQEEQLRLHTLFTNISREMSLLKGKKMNTGKSKGIENEISDALRAQMLRELREGHKGQLLPCQQESVQGIFRHILKKFPQLKALRCDVAEGKSFSEFLEKFVLLQWECILSSPQIHLLWWMDGLCAADLSPTCDIFHMPKQAGKPREKDQEAEHLKKPIMLFPSLQVNGQTIVRGLVLIPPLE
jgi:hypothetical protein